MFSFHYFFKNPLIYSLFDLVASGGIILIALLDAQKVKSLLGDADHLKRGIYEYRKEPQSQTIHIKLPFSEELYSEELVDIGELQQTLKPLRFSLTQQFNFLS